MENKEELLKKVKEFIERSGGGETCPDGEKAFNETVKRLSESGISSAELKEIEDFAADEVNRDKLHNFCTGGYGEAADGFEDGDKNPSAETVNHRFLYEDEKEKLINFVKKHKKDRSFGDTVFAVMEKYGLKPPQVYRRAMLSKQDFSRITGPKCKGIKTTTVWNFIIGLGCDLDEADELLFSAGKCRRQTLFDLVMEYMIRTKNYDVLAINEILDKLELPLLACHAEVRDKDAF